MLTGCVPSALNSETSAGAPGTRSFMPARSAADLIGLMLLVIWRKPRSQMRSIGTRLTLAVIWPRTNFPSSPSIVGQTLS